MSLIAVLESIAHRLEGFQTEEDRNKLHEQIAALGDEAVTDVHTLVHGVEADVATDVTPVDPTTEPAAPAPADLSTLTDDELAAELERRKAAGQ